jgi:hypothetical protein
MGLILITRKSIDYSSTSTQILLEDKIKGALSLSSYSPKGD